MTTVVEPTVEVTPLTQVQEDLLAVADLLERDGWKQGAYGPFNPDIHEPRCIAGALVAMLNRKASRPVYHSLLVLVSDRGRLVCDALGKHVGDPGIGAWNDHVCQSQAQAVAMLRDAAMEAQ